MRKAERLFQILTILRSRRTVMTADEIAEQLGVSVRTIYRDMQALSLSNIPLESEAGIGYRLRPGFTISPMMFEQDELEALALGAKMVKGWGDDALVEAVERALQKIYAVLPEKTFAFHHATDETVIVTDFGRQFASQFSDVIRKAIKRFAKLDIVYRNEKGQQTSRIIWPLGLIYWGKVWTLITWCQLREDYRVFRLDRICDLNVLRETFETSPSINLQTYLKNQEEKHKDLPLNS